MNRRVFVLVALGCGVVASQASAAILYESGTLGPIGTPIGTIPAANVSNSVFNGVRFELAQPAVTTRIGGHFVGATNANGTFFGAIVQLNGATDFPNSSDLSTADVLGHAVMAFPAPSAEVYGDLSVPLSPGWYALIFGGGLFGASGAGAMPLNNPDLGSPSYIGFQAGSGWLNLADLSDAFRFNNYRFVVQGDLVPEPATYVIAVATLLMASAGFKPSRRCC